MVLPANFIHTKGHPVELFCPTAADAAELSALRAQMDGESEFMGRESGEAVLSPAAFAERIEADIADARSLFLAARENGRVVGYARCAGNSLRRFAHKVEFGICVARSHWGLGIGRALMDSCISWADSVGIERIALDVVQDNANAIALYKSLGFVEEGVLVHDRIHSDGSSHNTVLMGRIVKSI